MTNEDEPLSLSEISQLHFWGRKNLLGQAYNPFRSSILVSTSIKTPVGLAEVEARERQLPDGTFYREIRVETEEKSSSWTEGGGWNTPLYQLGLTPSDIENAANGVLRTADLGEGAVRSSSFPKVKVLSVGRSKGASRSSRSKGPLAVLLQIDSAHIYIHKNRQGLSRIYCEQQGGNLRGFWSSETKQWEFYDAVNWEEIPRDTAPEACGWREDYFMVIDAVCRELGFAG